MLSIDLNYAKFVYKIIMISDLEYLRGPLKNIGMQEIGYPEGSGFSLFEEEAVLV